MHRILLAPPLAALSTPDVRRSIAWVTSITGIAGTSLVLLGLTAAIFAYRGAVNEPYNFANHFISELGEVGISELAAIFNTALVLSGLCFIVFMPGISHFIGGWCGAIFGAIGLLMGINATFVGILPVNHGSLHQTVAVNTFYLALGSMTLFSIYVLAFRKCSFPRWLVIPGLLSAGAFYALLFLGEPEYIRGTSPTEALYFSLHRPAFVQAAILEWIALLSIIIWVMCVSLYLQAWLRRREVSSQ